MAAPSFDDLYDIGKAEALLRRPDLFLAPGDIADFLVAAGAAMADKNVQFAAEEARKCFLDGNFGDDLTAYVNDRYGLLRQPASAAQVVLSFTRPTAGGGEPAGTISAGTVVATVEDATGARVEFTTDVDISWALSEVATKAVNATAVNTGRDGNVAIGAITNIVDAIFDSSITLTNLAAAGGGNEEETDDELRERARQFPATLRRGTLAALQQGSLTITTVRVATASEDVNGNVTVTVSDADGNSTAQMVADVATELENWRCAGTALTVVGGQVLTQNIAATLTLVAGTDLVVITPNIQEAIDARMGKLGMGETLFLEALQAAIICVDPDRITRVQLTDPVADVVPAANQVIRRGTLALVEA